MDDSTDKSLCIILDTNSWKKNLLLRTALGSALLYMMNRRGMKILLPEVIEQEIKKHTLLSAQEAKKAIEKGFRTIQSIVGFHKSYDIPTDAEVTEAIEKRFQKLGNFIESVPFSLDHAKSALLRVNQNIPPSSTKKQQYKDCAIWEAVLTAGESYKVHFVSNDGDFYQDKEIKTAYHM